MNIQELVTAAENNIDVKVVILHNGILGMVGQWQRLFYEHHYSASVLDYKRDFVKIAEAMGVRGVRIENKEELNKLPDILQTACRVYQIHIGLAGTFFQTSLYALP